MLPSKPETRSAAARRNRDNSVDPEGEFPLGAPEYFFYLVFQTARQRDLQFDRILKPAGLTVALWRSLAIIRRLDGCTMSQLARYSTVERTTLSRAVDQLVMRGFIQRSVPGHDRRQVILALTDLGEETYIRAVAILKEFNAGLLADVEHERLRDVTRVLQHALRKITGDDALATDLLTFGRAPG
ncbi:MarR family transcriptional regulator [Phenylobacterium sp.]|jgi:DNA-binding MarR family transcriptional regulator|uniref:MarR family winged helix-turn-helix transcriptional regulator n=1 Tax=Phenylobacterium sp. TaxID=1871053 RepID=UPI002F425C01